MSQSLGRIYLHLVFSTKNRERTIPDSVRGSLHAYMATVLSKLNCHANLINSVEDHVHLLFELARTVTISKVVSEVKTSSSQWIKTQSDIYRRFAWQSGYGVFSVSQLKVEAVREYIAQQREHHHKQTFQDELRLLCTRHHLELNELHAWD